LNDEKFYEKIAVVYDLKNDLFFNYQKDKKYEYDILLFILSDKSLKKIKDKDLNVEKFTDSVNDPNITHKSPQKVSTKKKYYVNSENLVNKFNENIVIYYDKSNNI